MICVRCKRDRPHNARGLCTGCYTHSRRSGTLEEDGMPTTRLTTSVPDPHVKWCPTCPDGGMVTTYAALADGRAESYICLAPAHEGRRRFARNERKISR